MKNQLAQINAEVIRKAEQRSAAHPPPHNLKTPFTVTELRHALYRERDQYAAKLREVVAQRDQYKAHAERLAEALRELFRECAMVHKYWGENCNQAASDAAVTKACQALAAWEGAQK